MGPETTRRVLALLALAGLGFALTAAALRPLVPWPEDYGLAAKLRWWEEHAQEYDLVFLGSSRVYRAFDPAAFEEELARHGRPLRAFNFGVGGVRPFEMDLILRAVLARAPERLRWVLFECLALDPRFPAREDPTAGRVVFWHTPGRTRDVLRALASTPFEPEDARELARERPLLARVAEAAGGLEPAWRLDLAHRHLQALLWNLTSYGQGPAMLGGLLDEDLTGARRTALTPEELAHRHGYVPFEENAEEVDQLRNERLRADPSDYLRRVRELEAEADELPDVGTLVPQVFAARGAAVRAAGAELVHVIVPDRSPRLEGRVLARAGAIETLFDLNQPLVWPELFTLESRYDMGHLSRAGALEFSRTLARLLAQHLESRP
ncbi:MAG TPA: hypothetical protein VF530_12855 [Planctomycetota bacterium]